MNNTQITNFPVSVYGNMEKFSDTISKGRCRVFYRGRNRNGTYITDEFAQKLIDSAPYTPVKGIYEIDDYTDHGARRDEGRIYGIVPQNPNFAWEKHLDADGIEREYACFDVLYYTALYKEAGEIHNKSESMELYRKTLKGDWKIIEGKKTYVFTDGCFLGLQALGDDVEPCFEGAGFYSNNNNESQTEVNIIAILEKYEKRPDLFQNYEQGGNNIMSTIEFKLSDNDKYNFLFALLNPEFNEAGGWVMNYCICDVYEQYAVVRNYQELIYERVYFTKNDENDSLEITNKERCYIVDVNEAEREALNNISGGGTFVEAYEAIVANKNTIEALNNSVSDLTEKNSAYSIKVEEQENTISTLTTERDAAQTNYDNAHARIAEIESEKTELSTNLNKAIEERDALVTYKKNIEDNAKKAVIEGYIEQLPEEVIESYMNNIDNYSIEDLDKELTYEQKKANPSIFSKNPVPPAQSAYVPKEDNGGNGIKDILARFENKNK